MWEIDSSGNASRPCDQYEGGETRQLRIKFAVVWRTIAGCVFYDEVWKTFDSEQEARQLIKEFVEERNKKE